MLSIDEQRNINKERAAQQQETITSLTEILDDKKADTEGGLNAQKLSITILNILLSGVETLFAKSRCDTAPILHLLGETILYNAFMRFVVGTVSSIYISFFNLRNNLYLYNVANYLIKKNTMLKFINLY